MTSIIYIKESFLQKKFHPKETKEIKKKIICFQ